MSARVGLLVPSSNVTMEIELPALLRQQLPEAEVPSLHAARMRMTAVTPTALAAMDAQAERCAAELADAQVDVLAYACLVAVMVQGPGSHRAAERRLTDAAGGAPVISSAGALVSGLHDLGAERVAMITPYAPALTATVIDYLAAEEVEVVDAISLGVTDNAAVGRLSHGPCRQPAPPARLDRRVSCVGGSGLQTAVAVTPGWAVCQMVWANGLSPSRRVPWLVTMEIQPWGDRHR